MRFINQFILLPSAQIGLHRTTEASSFHHILKNAKYAMAEEPQNTAFVASDDVFDYMLDIRNLNEGINDKRKERLAEYSEYKYSGFKFQSLDQLDELRLRNRARRGSKSTQKNWRIFQKAETNASNLPFLQQLVKQDKAEY